jgi:hypothetical protein
MIQDKELPSEYVSIRQIWLKSIGDCGRAISQRAVTEPGAQRQDECIGDRTVVYSIEALYYSLVDYGEATVRSDVNQYKENTFNPNIASIWESWERNKPDYKEGLTFNSPRKEREESKKDWLSIQECWQGHARESVKLFDFIIQTLNKYGMLFESQPKGFSNVEMISIQT